jgi:hypothetical protein
MITLYKKDSKGTILQWEAKTIQNTSGISILISYGELGGKLIENRRDNIQGKNINKVNETSPLSQAENDIQSLYNKKRREGYKSLDDLNFNDTSAAFTADKNIHLFLKENLRFNTTDLDGNLKPMKAQQYFRSSKTAKKPTWVDPTGKVWDDRKYYYLMSPFAKKESNAIIIKFPCLIQPKINGVRCTISINNLGKVQLLSKEGLEYSIPHIEQEFENYKEIFTTTIGEELIDIVFDGELYIHNELLQTISSAVKKPNLNTPRLKFVCFDLAIPNVKNIDRIKIMKSLLVHTIERLDSSIEYVKTLRIVDDYNVQLQTDTYIKDGYEGTILRDSEAIYTFGKRPMTMVKLKRCMDDEFKIIDVKPQTVNPSLALFVCITKDGKEFEVNPTGNEEFKSSILYQKHNYIGKLLTCTFYEYTEDGKPLHVINNTVRDYE